mgnify:CR=1 FL=1
MKGLIVNGNGKPELNHDIPMPEIGDYEVLTKTLACGICNGTDIKLVEGKLKGFSTYPAVLGHESVGEVVQIGKKVRNFKKGDRVLRTSLKSTSEYYSLWGGFSEYTIANDYQACVADGIEADEGTCTQQIIPKEIEPGEGAMIITLKEICSALHRLGLKKGDDVVVVGCGPVGISMVALARAMGAGNIILSGHHRERMKVAQRLGANIIVQSKEENLVEVIQEKLPTGVDLFIDCVGRTSIIDQGMKVVKETGKIGLYGIGMHTGDLIDWNQAPYNFQIHSVQWPIASEEMKTHNEVISYIQQGKINLKDFVTHQLKITDFERGFNLVNKREGLKVVLTF